MASATLCFTGFSRDEIAPILSQFEQANTALGNRWSLVPEADARVLVIDMDSMYGHMTWLKAQGTGKTTVGLTSGDRSETDLLLRRPVTAVSMKTLLMQLESGAGPASRITQSVPAVQPTPPTATPALAAEARQLSPAPALVAAPVAPPMQASAPPAATPAATAEAPKHNASADFIAAFTTGQMAAMAPVAPHEPRVSDYLPAGRLGGPTKLQVAGAPLIAFDPASQTYAGSATLKPLIPLVSALVEASEFTAIDMAEFERIKAASGGAQPYMRLLWLCGLSVSNGQLLPGFNPGRKFQLTKWPQIEREYPKHFRMATVMMKGPALIKEIADAAGLPETEVIDFVNAGLVTGSVVVEGSTTTTGDVAKASGLLAKPRPA